MPWGLRVPLAYCRAVGASSPSFIQSCQVVWICQRESLLSNESRFGLSPVFVRLIMVAPGGGVSSWTAPVSGGRAWRWSSMASSLGPSGVGWWVPWNPLLGVLGVSGLSPKLRPRPSVSRDSCHYRWQLATCAVHPAGLVSATASVVFRCGNRCRVR